MDETPERKMLDDAFSKLVKRAMPKPLRVRKSKYDPHQGKKECARRLRQLGTNNDTKGTS